MNEENEGEELSEEVLRRQEESEKKEEEKREGEVRAKSEKLIRFMSENF